MADDLYRRPSRAQAAGTRPWGSFGLFAETLLTGLLITCCGVLVVTIVPALAAGTAHLRRHLDGDVTSVRAFTADFRASWRTLWPIAVGAPILAGALVVNAVLLASGVAPGGGPMVAVMVALALAVAVVSLRAAARWRPARSSAADDAARTRPVGWALLVEAGRDAAEDPSGSLLVVVAIGCGAVLGWMFVPLIVIAPGLLALALVAVEHRLRGRRPPT